ncbi:MAG: hypothetical protein WCA22_09480 [Candidatus Binatus sp.]
MVVAFFLAGCHGQGNARSFTYRLRKPQNEQGYSTLHTMRDGALLVATKRLEQPKQIWTLTRIEAWDTSQPREDELDIDVGPNDELLGWLSQKDRSDRNDQLLMDPGGNYLVVRLSQNADTWNFPGFPGQSAKPLSVLNIIDLHGFKLLRRVVLTDPLLAAGDMGFSPSGAFVVSGLQDYRSATVDGKVTKTGQYAVETLTLPFLKPETVCTYTIINKLYLAETASTPEEKACGPKLVPLGFSSLDDLRKSLNSLGMAEYNADHTPTSLAENLPSGCTFEDLSANLKYALVDCDESRVQMTFFSWYRGFKVLDLEDRTQIMDLRVPRGSLASHGWGRPRFSGVLATSRGVTYVVLLHDGAELEGYRVP